MPERNKDEPMTNEPMGVSMDETDSGLAQSPKDPATGEVEPSVGPMDRPGTEAEDEASKNGVPRK